MDFSSSQFTGEMYDDINYIGFPGFEDIANYPEFAMEATDVDDETLSLSSCDSPTEEKPRFANMQRHFGSTCSSPCDVDSDEQDAFDFWDMDDPLFASEGDASPPSLGQAFNVKSEMGLPQYADFPAMEFESGNQLLTFQDLTFERDEPILENYELLKFLMDKAGELVRNPRTQINFLTKANESYQDPTSTQHSAFNASNPINNNNSNTAYFSKIMERAQQQPMRLQRSQPDQKPFSEVKIKREPFTQDVTVRESERQPEASPTQQKLKRKKRKYERRSTARKSIQLYEFMLDLLDKKDDSVTWVSREDGVFKLLKSKGVAQMWGKYKKNENMTYESLSRALRHYYSQEILLPVPKKLHYKFCKKTLENWYKGKSIC